MVCDERIWKSFKGLHIGLLDDQQDRVFRKGQVTLHLTVWEYELRDEEQGPFPEGWYSRKCTVQIVQQARM